jgi:hypothetical protein
MKKPRSFFNRKPRPKGWKRSIHTVATRDRRERLALGVPMPRTGEGYLLAPSVVLFAAILGTRRAYEWALDSLDGARRVDARRFW